jgi:hypothetical protein
MRFLRSFVVFCAVLVPLAAFSSQDDGTQKAKTIDELAKMYDSSSCKECHSEIWEQWQKSLHARSLFGPEVTGRTCATIKTTIENGLMDWPDSGVKTPADVKVKHLWICAKCHLPQLKDAEDSVAQEIVKNVYAFANDGDEKAAATLQKLNVGCLICHNRNAIIHKWKFGYPQKDAVYGTKDAEHADPVHPVMKKSPYMKESILCGQCHGLGPNLELDEPTQCATLYASYLMAYKAEGGTETCQECHMEKSKLGHNMQSYRSAEMGQMAVEFRATAFGYQWRDGSITTPAGIVQVEMTNHAGHGIPDG